MKSRAVKLNRGAPEGGFWAEGPQICFVKCICVCVCVCVCVGFVMCGCFGSTCTCIYCVYIVCTVFFFVSFMYIICFVCTSVRTTATE